MIRIPLLASTWENSLRTNDVIDCQPGLHIIMITATTGIAGSTSCGQVGTHVAVSTIRSTTAINIDFCKSTRRGVGCVLSVLIYSECNLACKATSASQSVVVAGNLIGWDELVFGSSASSATSSPRSVWSSANAGESKIEYINPQQYKRETA